ncbi:MAG: class I SAM-dependent methyltransferase [Spirochaetota bacterium]
MEAKDLAQAEFFRNRLLKNERHLRKWARREGVFAFRVYDRDIPEVPLAVDIFRSTRGFGTGDREEDCLLVALYERPYDKDPALEAAWLALMSVTAAESLGISPECCFSRTRRRQRGINQYERVDGGAAERVVTEGGLSFIVNLSDYLDTGLFLDHRPTRALVRSLSKGKRVLNLYSYTGSFSVYAAAGGASEVHSVDLSNTYLAWAGRNLALNGFEGGAFPLIKADVRSFLESSRRGGASWDLIVADPPTFSNSKAATMDFDVNRDWHLLIRDCLALLAPGGTLFFSTNSRKLKWEGELVKGTWKDVSEACLPADFRDKRIRKTWMLQGG